MSRAGCPLVPVEPLSTDSIHQCGGVRSSAGCRYGAGIVDENMPDLYRDHYFTAVIVVAAVIVYVVQAGY